MCCDNCIRKRNCTHRFETIYDLIGFLDDSSGREPISRPSDDESSDLRPTTPVKGWGNTRKGNRFTLRSQVLEDWRYNCWKRDYRLCSWGVAGVISDPVLTKLAGSFKLKTIENLLEAFPDWGYASKYGGEVLSLLEDADRRQRLASQAQSMQTRQANKKRKLEDMQRGEEQQDEGGSIHSSSLAIPPISPPESPHFSNVSLPLTLTCTQTINPITVTYIPPPMRPQPPRPRPQPQPKLFVPPLMVSRPYIRADPLDSLMNDIRST